MSRTIRQAPIADDPARTNDMEPPPDPITPVAPEPPFDESPSPLPAPGATDKRKIGRNIAATVATQLVTWALTFIVTIYLPRYIGPEGSGKFGQSSAFVALFSMFAPLGTSQVLVKEIARNRTRLGELLVMSLCLRLPLALSMGVLAGLFGWLIYPPATFLLICVNIAAMPIGMINDACSAALQGQENLPRQGFSAIAERFLSAAIILGLVFAHVNPVTHLWLFALAGLAASLLQLSFHLWNYRRVWRGARLPKWGELRWMAAAGLPFLGWAIFQTIYGKTDALVLGWVVRWMSNDIALSDTVAGWYLTSFRLIGTTLFFPVAISTALLPTLARLYTAGETAPFQRLAHKSLEIALLIGVPLAVLFAVAAGPIITTLYGTRFYGAIPVLQVSGLSCLMYYIGCVLGTLVNAVDRQKEMLKVTVVAALIGVPRCIVMVWLTQRYMGNGAIGAMFSGALLEVFLIRSYLRILPPRLFGRETVLKILRSALASLPMAGLLWLILARHWGLYFILLCPVLYAVGLIVFRAVDRSDFETLRDAFRRRAS